MNAINRMGRIRFWLGMFVALLGGTSSVFAAQQGSSAFDQKKAMRISQEAIGRNVSDHAFTNIKGEPVTLEDFKGSPTVVSLIYTSCYHICPMVTRHLATVVPKARQALGAESFDVLTIGFDANVDTPKAMAAFARKQGVINRPRWHFLSADRGTISKLAKEVGFTYKRSPKGFDHIVQATVLDREHQVYRQVYGRQFDAPLLVEPLKALVFDRYTEPRSVGDMWNRLLFFCTTYDPATGSYDFDYGFFVGMGVALIMLIGMTVFLVSMIRQRAS